MSFMYAYNNTFCSASGLQLSNVKRSHPSFFIFFLMQFINQQRITGLDFSLKKPQSYFFSFCFFYLLI